MGRRRHKPGGQHFIYSGFLHNGNFTAIFWLLLSLLLYGNTIPNDYAEDDWRITAENPLVSKGVGAIPEILSTRYSKTLESTFGAKESTGFEYRPVAKVSFAIEAELFGKNPHVGHLINVLIYGLSLLLTFLVLNRLFPGKASLIFLVTVLFAVHPIHTEVVASLKNREVLLSYLFGFSGWWMLLQHQASKSVRYLIAGLPLLGLSILSKADAIGLLIVIPFSFYFLLSVPARRSIIYGLLVLAAFAVFKLTPEFFLPPYDRPHYFWENPLFGDYTILNHVRLVLSTIGIYISKLIVPHPLLFYYGYNMVPYESFLNGYVLTGAGVLAAAVFGLAVTLHRRAKLFAFAIVFAAAFHLLFSNIVIFISGTVAERHLFFTSLGFCLAVAASFEFLASRFGHRRIWQFMIAGVLLAYTYLTIDRNADWKNYFTLHHSARPYIENSAKANAMLGVSYLAEIGKDDRNIRLYAADAEACLERAVELDPEIQSAWNNLGFIYLQTQRYELARNAFEKELSITGPSTETLSNLGSLYARQKKYNAAAGYFNRALEIDNEYYPALRDLLYCYVAQNDVPGTDSLIHRYREIHPQEILYGQVADFYLMKKDTASACRYLAVGGVENSLNCDAK